MAARTLLLDLDGTLWNSHRCYAAALAEAGVLDEPRAIAALGRGENLIRLARDGGLNSSQFSRLCERFVKCLSLYDGVPDSLRELAMRGISVSVVTNLPGQIAIPLLDALSLRRHFSAIVCAAGKPSPNKIRQALSQLLPGGEPETVYLVGDMPSDAQAAARAGIRFAWASYGYCSEQPDGTDVTLGSFSEVLAL